MSIELTVTESLGFGIDSNVVFLDFPSDRGSLRYAILHTEKTGDDYLLDIASFDRVTVTQKGPYFHVGENNFIALQNVRLKDGTLSLGHEEFDDIAAWRIEPNAEVSLYRWALADYPTDNENEDWDRRVVPIVRAAGSYGRLIGCARATGAELAHADFEAE